MISYKSLEVWKLSMETVKEIYMLTKNYPPEERYGLTSQTNRAAVSIPTNIAEGVGRSHKRECLQFLFVSRGSAYELETLLSIALMTNTISQGIYEKLNSMLESNIRMITGFINYIKQKS